MYYTFFPNLFGHLVKNEILNKKAFQYDAYRPLADCKCFSSHQPNVTTWWGGPQVNTYDQVTSLSHLMSLAFGWKAGLRPGSPCTVGSNASWVMVIWDPPLWTDDHVHGGQA